MVELRCCIYCLGVMTVLVVACSDSTTPDPEVCEGFPNWATSPYVLPYPKGAAYFVDQANCPPVGNGHRGVARYGYDFLMPIGSTITAARGGTVTNVEESHFDGEIAPTGEDNFLVILHGDGTSALYGHFTHDGVLVSVGQVVNAGDVVGFSGNAGNTANKPHLHTSESRCNPVTNGTAACPTTPITFSNTDPNPQGLQAGRSYTAR